MNEDEVQGRLLHSHVARQRHPDRPRPSTPYEVMSNDLVRGGMPRMDAIARVDCVTGQRATEVTIRFELSEHLIIRWPAQCERASRILNSSTSTMSEKLHALAGIVGLGDLPVTLDVELSVPTEKAPAILKRRVRALDLG